MCVRQIVCLGVLFLPSAPCHYHQNLQKEQQANTAAAVLSTASAAATHRERVALPARREELARALSIQAPVRRGPLLLKAGHDLSRPGRQLGR